jgi:hypothetical protein
MAGMGQQYALGSARLDGSIASIADLSPAALLPCSGLLIRAGMRKAALHAFVHGSSVGSADATTL